MDQEKLDEAKDLMVKLANDNYSDVDTRKGTVSNDLLLSLAALGYASISEDLTAFESKMYLQQILEDPATVDNSVVDGILSNFYISRKQGSKAQGKIKLIVSDQREYYVESESEFRTVAGLKYLTTTAVSVTADDLFSESGTENYYFSVDVEAEAVGSAYTVGAGTVFETDILSGSLVSAEAFNDFHSGIDEEANEALLSRVPTSLGARSLANRQGISTLLQEQFPDIRQLTVIGFNDREMQRDINNAGFKVGGKADIYVRTATEPLTGTIEKTTDSSGLTTLSGEGEVPVLRVRNYALATNPAVTYDTFTINVTSEEQYPYLYRFSQEEIIEITTSHPEQDIVVYVDYVPFIKDIQEYVDSDEVRYLRSDTLVKAYMPCFISLTVNYQSDFPASDTEAAIQSTLVNYINGYDADVLYVSKIVDQLHAIDITTIELPLEITGTFYLPDGTTEAVTSENSIQIESNYELGASSKTYRFYLSPSDLSMNQVV